MKYYYGCKQESLRLYPATVAGLRVVPKDIVLRGYKVPADTAVMWNYMLIGRDPNFFDKPGNLPCYWDLTLQWTLLSTIERKSRFMYDLAVWHNFEN